MSTSDARPALLASLSRAVFAATLLPWFAISALSRFAGNDLSMGPAVDGGLLSLGAFYAYLPDTAAASLTGPTDFSTGQWAYVVTMSGLELLLPVLLVMGLFARIASLGLILHQTVAWGVAAPSLASGALFDANPFDMMPDQLLLWAALLAPVVAFGAGPVSVDAALRRLRHGKASAAKGASSATRAPGSPRMRNPS